MGTGSAVLAAAMSLGGHGAARAQDASLSSAAAFTLTRVVFRGNRAVDDAALNALAASYLGKSATLADLERLAAEVTGLYRARGYFLAQALVPQQAIRDGQVEITVLEGRLGKIEVQVAANAPITEPRIRAFLALLQPGAALQEASYERTMLLLSDLPGVRVQAGLKEGADTGTTDVVVEVSSADRRWEAAAALDNFGTRASGRYRATANGRYLSPFSIGDNLDARLLVTSNGGETYGRLAYEAPLNARGLRAGASLSRVSYELGPPYEALGATGTALVFEASLLYPILRSRPRNLFVRASLYSKRLNDRTDSLGIANQRRVDAIGATLSWEARDPLFGGGYTGADATLYRGRLRFDNDAASAIDQSTLGHQTAGNYSKLNLQVQRLQALFGRHNLHVQLNGQWASRNLDSSEKLSLGGDGAVRAYTSGELLVDTGWIASVEWRYSLTNDLVVALLYDAAHGSQARTPNPNDTANSRGLRGPGLGVNWNAPHAFTVRGSLAWPTSGPAVSEGGGEGARLLVQVQKAF